MQKNVSKPTSSRSLSFSETFSVAVERAAKNQTNAAFIANILTKTTSYEQNCREEPVLTLFQLLNLSTLVHDSWRA